MSLWTLRVLMAFYSVLCVSTWFEGRRNWTIYFVGAIVLTWGIIREMKKEVVP